MTGCHIEQKNQPGNCKMGQNTPQAMGKDVLGTFMAHPGVIPGPGFKRRLLLGKKDRRRRCFSGTNATPLQ